MLSVSRYSVIPSNVDLVKQYRYDLLARKSYEWHEFSSEADLLKESIHNSYTVFLRKLLESKRGQVNNLGGSGADAFKNEKTYGLQSDQMIESDRIAMTGSNNPNPDNLTWLTNVTTASSREVVRHGTMERLSASTLQSPESLLCSPNFFHHAAGNTANPTSAGHQQQYATEYQATFPHIEGNNVSSFYRQTPHLAQTYASVYRSHYASSPTETTSLVMPGHQNFHIEPYPYLSDLPSSASSHQLQLPHSLAFLAVAAPKASSQQTSPVYPLYPALAGSKEKSSGRITLHSSVPSPKEDKQSSESTLVDINAKIPHLSKTIQNEQTHPYFVFSKTKEKRLMKEQAFSSPYRVPAGKEGSLKHRILRPPPNIDIYQSSASDIDSAPLSAPPTTECMDDLTSLKQTSFNVLPLPHASTNSLSVQKGASFSRVSQHHHPAYFMKGSIIQLANGHLKCVEDLQTCDFVESAESSTDLSVDYSTIIRIEEVPGSGLAILGFSVGEKQVQITAEAPLEHPFFIWNQGWSSCSPELSMHRYNLSCCKLRVGDVCISLTRKAKKDSEASPKVTQSSCVTFAIQDASAKSSPVQSYPQEHSVLYKSAQSLSSFAPSETSHSQPSEESSPKRKRKRCSSAPDYISS